MALKIGGNTIVDNSRNGSLINLTLSGTLTAGGSTGTSGQVLQSTGTGLQWATLSSVATAGNISGGSAGQLVYQSAVGTTGFTAVGTSGQVLLSGATGAPTWSNQGSLVVGSSNTSTNISGGSAGQLVYQSAVGTTGFTAVGTSGQVLLSGATGAPTGPDQGSLSVGNSVSAGSATTSSNISGGGANRLAYQTASGTTGFITAPITASTYLQWNGTAFVWGTVSSGTNVTITNDTSTDATRYPLFSDTTVGTVSTIYTGNAKYVYNPATGGLQAPNLIASNGLVLNNSTVGASFTVDNGNNAFSVGPVTVASGITITVASGQRWLVV